MPLDSLYAEERGRVLKTIHEWFDEESIDRSSRSFLGKVWQTYGKETAKAVKTYFEELSLPIPDVDEYTHARDGGFIVFLNQAGMLIRISDKHEALDLEDEDDLHPVLRRATGKCFSDLNPGVGKPVPLDILSEMASRKEFDTEPTNVCELPGVFDDQGRVVGVLIDPGGKGSPSVFDIVKRKFFHKENKASSPQDILYGDLRNLFNKAWPAKSAHADPSMLQQAWQECLHMKKSGKLLTLWDDENDSADPKNKKGGVLYAQRWDVGA